MARLSDPSITSGGRLGEEKKEKKEGLKQSFSKKRETVVPTNAPVSRCGLRYTLHLRVEDCERGGMRPALFDEERNEAGKRCGGM